MLKITNPYAGNHFSCNPRQEQPASKSGTLAGRLSTLPIHSIVQPSPWARQKRPVIPTPVESLATFAELTNGNEAVRWNSHDRHQSSALQGGPRRRPKECCSNADRARNDLTMFDHNWPEAVDRGSSLPRIVSGDKRTLLRMRSFGDSYLVWTDRRRRGSLTAKVDPGPRSGEHHRIQRAIGSHRGCWRTCRRRLASPYRR